MAEASIGTIKMGLGEVQKTLGDSIGQVKPVSEARTAVGEQLTTAKELLDQALGALGLGATKNEEGRSAVGEIKATVTKAQEGLTPHGLEGSNDPNIQQIPGRVAGLHEGLDGTNGAFAANHTAINGLTEQIQGIRTTIEEEFSNFMGATENVETAHPEPTTAIMQDIEKFGARL